MAKEIYLYKSSKQHGPYTVDDLRSFLREGKVEPTVMSRVDDSFDWLPLFCIPEIRADSTPAEVLDGATSGDSKIELAVVERTAEEVRQSIERLGNVRGDHRAEIQKNIQRKSQILWKQVYAFKAQFPDGFEARMIEALYYRLQALTKFNAVGSMRKQSEETTSLVWGAVTGLLANRQEKDNAREALALLERAVTIYDNPDDRLMRAIIFHLLRQRDDALQEVRHILITWKPEENLEQFIDARQLRDELESFES